MKTILSIILLVACLSLSAVIDNAMPFMQIPPSSISRAMGGGYIGVADVWHMSPFVAWDNPAMPAMHEGIAFGFTRDNYEEGTNDPDCYYNSGIATIGYRGIGLLLPSLNPYGNFGTYFDYGNPSMVIVNAQNYNEKYAYDAAMQYGLSFDLLRYLQATEHSYPAVFEGLNVSAGMAYTRIIRNYMNYYYSIPVMDKVKSDVIDLGVLASVKKPLSEKLVLEGSLGYKRYDLTNEYIKYPDGYNEPVGQNDVFGLGMGASLPITVLNEDFPLQDWTENLLTGRVLADLNKSRYITETNSVGMELGFLDTVFLRGGSFQDEWNIDKGLTWGFGINLHNKAIWALQYNFARMYTRYEDSVFSSDYNEVTNSWDAMLSIDGIKLLNSLSK